MVNKTEKVNKLIETSGMHKIIFNIFNKMSTQIPGATKVDYFNVDDFIDNVVVNKLLKLDVKTLDILNMMFSYPENKDAFLEFNNVLDFNNRADVLKIQSILLRPTKKRNNS